MEKNGHSHPGHGALGIGRRLQRHWGINIAKKLRRVKKRRMGNGAGPMEEKEKKGPGL